MNPLPRRSTLPALVTSLLLAACAAALDQPAAHAGQWPPPWQDRPDAVQRADTPPHFEPPSARHCRRLPPTHEVGGRDPQRQGAASERRESTDAAAPTRRARSAAEAAAKSVAPATAGATAAPLAADSSAHERHMPPAPWPQPHPLPSPQRPAHEPVTAGMVDDNADFGEYLAYRQRQAGLPVHERDISERYLIEVSDAAGRPVHDAEVAVQRAGAAEPVMWARTDTAGRVWLHPRAFLPQRATHERALGVAVRKHGLQGRAMLSRGQPQAVQVRLGGAAPVIRPRLDLVFLVDATGSMDDEIAKLKASMRAMSQQIAQLPGRPDICYGLVAYRDRGDAFLTRSHDFTDDLPAFQRMLGRLHAGGGGDKPEALNEALHEVVHGLSWRSDAARIVVLVADAAPHLDYGGPQYDTDMQAALAKGIKLFAVGTSGLEPEGEYIYRQIAQYTAGRFVFLTYRDASDPGSGPGTQTPHDVSQYSVQTLDRLIVRLVSEEMARLRPA